MVMKDSLELECLEHVCLFIPLCIHISAQALPLVARARAKSWCAVQKARTDWRNISLTKVCWKTGAEFANVNIAPRFLLF